MSNTVLVTGAAGFIGSHLIEHLLATTDLKVRAMVRYNSQSSIGNLLFVGENERLEIVAGDLRDAEFCNHAVRGCKYVFHLGALIAIPYSYVNPSDFFQTNVLGSLNMLNAARQEPKLERFVQTSTSEVYGTALYMPIDEKHPLQPQSPYSASKIGSDSCAESFYRSFDMPVTIIRPFNTYGPRQSSRAVIPTIISQLVKSPNLKLGSLDTKRDFLFVGDTAAGFWQVGTHAGTLGVTLNLGTGRDVSIGDVVDICGKKIGVKPVVTTDPSRVRPEKSEVYHLIADAAKAGEMSGWKPAVSLEEGLERTIAWIRDHVDSFKPGTYRI